MRTTGALFYQNSIRRIQPFVKQLVSNIKNAPALERFDFEFAIIGLGDMEKIHAGAPKLQQLKIVWVLPQDEDNITIAEGNEEAFFMESW
jgi:hypothetical protein